MERNKENYYQQLNRTFNKNDLFHQDILVAKVGSSTIIGSNGEVNQRLLDHIAWQTSELMNWGYKVAIVTSGAVALGRNKYGELNGGIVGKQVLASIGQSSLGKAWERAFDKQNRISGYSVFSESDLLKTVAISDDPLAKAFEGQVVPIINANDAVNPSEIEQLMISADNDRLAGFVARRLGAARLILLTEAPGVWDKNQRVLEEMTRMIDIFNMYYQEKTEYGTGGIESKVEVAMSFALNGRVAFIADGRREGVLLDIAKGKSPGTRIRMAA